VCLKQWFLPPSAYFENADSRRKLLPPSAYFENADSRRKLRGTNKIVFYWMNEQIRIFHSSAPTKECLRYHPLGAPTYYLIHPLLGASKPSRKGRCFLTHTRSFCPPMDAKGKHATEALTFLHDAGVKKFHFFLQHSSPAPSLL
jgi:hypothetical protein